MSEPYGEEYVVKIKDQHAKGSDTCEWRTVSPSSRYDAVHTVAGALLAGADSVNVIREKDDE